MPALIVETPNSKLEAHLVLNPDARLADVGVLLLHPYKLLGGSMRDAVVSELCRQACSGGQFGAVLRYNQRGVGASSGSRFAPRNLRGQEDAADVLEMLDFLAGHLEGSNKRVIVIGYSWGACLAAYALDHPLLAAYIGVSFPLGGLAALLQTATLFGRVTAASTVPRLLVLGELDQWTTETAISAAMHAGGGGRLEESSSFQPAAAVAPGGASHAPLLLKVITDNDHFWANDCAAMAEYCLAYAQHVASDG